MPLVVGAYGWTKVGDVHWWGFAVGSALSGVSLMVDENVCGMDPGVSITDGKVTHSRELERRVKKYRAFWDGTHRDIVVQTNVEEQRLGVDEYAISVLEVNTIERKWGQGAKAIGGDRSARYTGR